MPGSFSCGLGPTGLLWASQDATLAGGEIVAIDPVRLDLRARGRVHVRIVDQPVPVGVQVAAVQEVVGVGLGQRHQRPRRVQIYAEQLHALVALVVLADNHGAAIWGPRGDIGVVGGVGQAGGWGGTVGRRDVDIGGGADVVPRPGDPAPVR